MAKSKNTATGDNGQPWYQDGLRFKCTGCGNCCTGSPGYVWVNQAEINALAAHLE
ncbi:MAG: YkgJ family cysteine cluster protein, partial [Planctomycetes bacterium]|nr:YkgJ family cysteine cluster protein [Planctomycetota bacterium]